MARTPETSPVADDATAPSTADLAAQLEALKADIVGLSETIAALGKAKGKEVKEYAAAEAAALRERGEEKVAHLQQRAGVLSDQANAMINQNPATAIGVAAGVGFLVGILLTRK